MRIELPLKRIHPDNLRAELLAEGVVLPVGFDSIIVRGNQVVLSLPDGTDESTVQQVYAAHVAPEDKTPEQIAKERLVQSLAATDTDAQRIRAIAMALYRAHVEMRVAFNGLLDSLAGIGVPLPPKMRIRTWEEAERDLIAEIQGTEAANLKPSMMSAGDIDPAWEDDRIDREREVQP
jgi:hypothetical protein